MRSNMYIARKEDSPEVILDATKKKFSITGVSMPEDSLTFYRPIIQWLEEYVAQPFDSLCLDIKLLDSVIITDSNRYFSFQNETESEY